ncbi:MAG: ABC transporter permease [Actinomycetota bacterium]|nr:ABC transporter permease [Actinomycetota bacterium]MDQ6947845.1 ABC transporter permease [Actinomycetota bacterium]
MTVARARPAASEPSMVEDLLEPASPSSPDQPRRGNHRRWTSALLSYLVMVYVLITLNFLLPRLMPGDPINGLLGQASSHFNGGDQTRAALRKYYGLNGSVLSQYRHYLWRLAHGDLGRSVTNLASVGHEIRRALPWTLLLIGSSIAVSLTIGMVAGIHAGWRRDRPADRALMTGLIAVWQFPSYLLGSILLFVFAVKFHWLPLNGAQTDLAGFGWVQKVPDIGRHLLLPLVVLTASLTAWNYLLMRAGMVTELGSDYLMLGRAKGLRPRRLKYRYAARNALLPLVSNAALDIGFAVAANVVVEQVFSYPGLGGLLFGSIATRDYPVIQGVFLVLSLGIVTINALADVLYRRLDPRTAV